MCEVPYCKTQWLDDIKLWFVDAALCDTANRVSSEWSQHTGRELISQSQCFCIFMHQKLPTAQ